MSQSLSRIALHIIFSTKERFPFLKDPEFRGQMHRYLAGAFNGLESPAIEVGGVQDHVHVLCLLSRTLSVSETIQKAKASSSSWAKHHEGLLRKFSWQTGYGAFSVNPLQMDPVREYIRRQEEHHRKRTFQEEYLEILRQYRVEYDERYLWS